MVLWLRHEALETCARGIAGDKSSASQQSKNVPSEARKQCASRKTLRHSDGCEEKDSIRRKHDFLLPDGPDDGWVVLRYSEYRGVPP